jgi:hypothetical protein
VLELTVLAQPTPVLTASVPSGATVPAHATLRSSPIGVDRSRRPCPAS